MLVSPYFSETLLDLYRKAQAMPVTAFSPFAIDTIKKFIDFDSAMFGLLSRNETGFLQGHYMYEFDDYEGYTLPSRLKVEFCDHSRSQLTISGAQVQIVKIGHFHFLSIRTPCRLAVLTERELAIARFYGTGLSNKEIAAELEISPLTVRKHIEAVYTKLRINNKADLAYLIHASAGAPMLEKLVANFAVDGALG